MAKSSFAIFNFWCSVHYKFGGGALVNPKSVPVKGKIKFLARFRDVKDKLPNDADSTANAYLLWLYVHNPSGVSDLTAYGLLDNITRHTGAFKKWYRANVSAGDEPNSGVAQIVLSTRPQEFTEVDSDMFKMLEETYHVMARME
jgi:hypothetical protein